VVGRQPNAPTTFTPGEIPGTHFQRLSQPQGTWFSRRKHRKNPMTPPGICPRTIWLVAQCLNHYATTGSSRIVTMKINQYPTKWIFPTIFSLDKFALVYICSTQLSRKYMNMNKQCRN